MYIHTGEREERVFDLIDKKKKSWFSISNFGGRKKRKATNFYDASMSTNEVKLISR